MCEERVKKHFKTIFEPILTHIMFDIEPDKQRSGIDFEVHKRSLSFDVKCRNAYAYKFGDILLETMSVVENGTRGWLYTSKSDIIVYAWNNASNTKFIDGYLVYMERTRNWLTDTNILSKFKVRVAHSYRNGLCWNTTNIAVPITSFPDDCIQRVDIESMKQDDRDVMSDWFEPNNRKV